MLTRDQVNLAYQFLKNRLLPGNMIRGLLYHPTEYWCQFYNVKQYGIVCAVTFHLVSKNFNRSTNLLRLDSQIFKHNLNHKICSEYLDNL